jgi:hypothetical protein
MRNSRNARTIRSAIVGICVAALLIIAAANVIGITRPKPTFRPTPKRSQPVISTLATYVPNNAMVETTNPGAPAKEGLARNIRNIDRVVVAGGLRIDVLAMECGLTKVGSGYATLAAGPGSQWCLVRVNIKNLSSSPALWSAGSETAYDAKGRNFSSESEAELYVSNSNLFGVMNPGVSAPDVIPFQLPMSDRLVRISFPTASNEAQVSVALD